MQSNPPLSFPIILIITHPLVKSPSTLAVEACRWEIGAHHRVITRGSTHRDSLMNAAAMKRDRAPDIRDTSRVMSASSILIKIIEF